MTDNDLWLTAVELAEILGTGLLGSVVGLIVTASVVLVALAAILMLVRRWSAASTFRALAAELRSSHRRANVDDGSLRHSDLARYRVAVTRVDKDLPIGLVDRWDEFVEGIVDTGHGLRNTLPADSFFPAGTLADAISLGLGPGRQISTSAWKLAPSTLTSLGLLGTFLGIALGLADLSITGEDAAQQITLVLPEVVKKLTTAFSTSILGVGTGLAVSVFGQAFVDNRLHAAISEFTGALDRIIRLQTAEALLLEQLEEMRDIFGARVVAGASQSEGATEPESDEAAGPGRRLDLRDELRRSWRVQQVMLDALPRSMASEMRAAVEDSLAPTLKQAVKVIGREAKRSGDAGSIAVQRILDQVHEQLRDAVTTPLRQAEAAAKELSTSIQASGADLNLAMSAARGAASDLAKGARAATSEAYKQQELLRARGDATEQLVSQLNAVQQSAEAMLAALQAATERSDEESRQARDSHAALARSVRSLTRSTRSLEGTLEALDTASSQIEAAGARATAALDSQGSAAERSIKRLTDTAGDFGAAMETNTRAMASLQTSLPELAGIMRETTDAAEQRLAAFGRLADRVDAIVKLSQRDQAQVEEPHKRLRRLVDGMAEEQGEESSSLVGRGTTTGPDHVGASGAAVRATSPPPKPPVSRTRSWFGRGSRD